jgi:PHD/YefM family antitoxin component YafN of YafNO toxin-antitoxin module
VDRGIPPLGTLTPSARDRICVHVRATLFVVDRKPHDVLATREARAQLPALLARFRQAGADAEPVVIGARRRPEAVVLSYERYLKLAGGRERVAAALEQQAREVDTTLDADQAMELANSELHAMRRERRAPKRR